MASLRAGWKGQVRVIHALMIRELITRFGRENFGFLWMMIEPLLFASIVGFMWTLLRGTYEHGGISTAAFVATGYIPLTLFRHMMTRSVEAFTANSSLLYHRQITIIDLILSRFAIEFIGSMMAFVFISTVLFGFGLMPFPAYPGYVLTGWALYSLFILSISFIVGPLSRISDSVEKLIPVITYVMIPFSGAFTMNSWLTPGLRAYLIYSPFVDPMEMIRYGVFGELVTPYYDPMVPIYCFLFCMLIGLIMCKRARRTLAVE